MLIPILTSRSKGVFYLNTSSFVPYGILEPLCKAGQVSLLKIIGESYLSVCRYKNYVHYRIIPCKYLNWLYKLERNIN